ncbi:hypothetical protein B0H10DRAFT_2221656 [Mycena sp. CBHHK59/15]|nr:hypothetical protein B0H10DRAFT_2221656 [Mycena sp. CBHHK59/15]
MPKQLVVDATLVQRKTWSIFLDDPLPPMLVPTSQHLAPSGVKEIWMAPGALMLLALAISIIIVPALTALHGRPVAKPSHMTTSAQAVDAHFTYREPGDDFRRTAIDIAPFSSDWDDFVQSWFFTVPPDWHDLTEIDFYVKRLLKIPGAIRPLAFLRACDPCLVFAADGEYYYINTCTEFLERFGGDFASDDEFLARLPGLKGVLEAFPADTYKMYAAVCREQQRLAKAARKQRRG